MQHLAADFMALAGATSAPTPNLERVCALIDPATPALPEGSARIPMEWRSVWTGLLALAGVGLGFVWLRNQRRPLQLRVHSQPTRAHTGQKREKESP
jgi:hypothetical protein